MFLISLYSFLIIFEGFNMANKSIGVDFVSSEHKSSEKSSYKSNEPIVSFENAVITKKSTTESKFIVEIFVV